MPTRTQLDEANGASRIFDWSSVDALTDEQIVEAARADPDSSLTTHEELAEFNLVIPAKSRRKPLQEAAK